MEIMWFGSIQATLQSSTAIIIFARKIL